MLVPSRNRYTFPLSLPGRSQSKFGKIQGFVGAYLPPLYAILNLCSKTKQAPKVRGRLRETPLAHNPPAVQAQGDPSLLLPRTVVNLPHLKSKATQRCG